MTAERIVNQIGPTISAAAAAVSTLSGRWWLIVPFVAFAVVWVAFVVYFDLAGRWRRNRREAKLAAIDDARLTLELEKALAMPNAKEALADLLARHGPGVDGEIYVAATQDRDASKASVS